MKTRSRISLFERLMDKTISSIFEKVLESLPVIGPIYRAIKLFNTLMDLGCRFASGQ